MLNHNTKQVVQVVRCGCTRNATVPCSCSYRLHSTIQGISNTSALSRTFKLSMYEQPFMCCEDQQCVVHQCAADLQGRV